MSLNVQVLSQRLGNVLSGVSLLVVGKTLLVAVLGRLFGLTPVQGIRAGLMLGPGGEFAFVGFKEAVRKVHKIQLPLPSSPPPSFCAAFPL